VVIVESRVLYPMMGEVSLDGPVDPIGGTRMVRRGHDLTIVTWSQMVPKAIEAADRLSTDGLEAAVFDLRWLSPLDLDPVLDSISVNRRALVVHEAVRTGGFGGEIVATITERCFGELAAPVGRVATADVPMPAAPSLQRAAVPDVDDIVMAARRILAQMPAQ
jgi:pyruvate/2-oxoglutarate/acetoin dehydrogenase E1 component